MMFRQSYEAQDFGSDKHIKFVTNRVDLTEEHFANMCLSFGSYTRKTSLVRDCSDDISRTIREYAISETVNRSLKCQLQNFSECLVTAGDYQQALIDRLEANVIGRLSQYEKICKSAKDDIKASVRSNNTFIEKQRHLRKLKEKSQINRQDLAEADLTKARVEATKSKKSLNDSIRTFETKKLQDLKLVLQNFVKCEMIFHAKALELYTEAFKHIQCINEVDDMQELENCVTLLHPEANQSFTEKKLPENELVNKSSLSRESIQSVTSQSKFTDSNTDDEDDSEDSLSSSESETH